MSVIKWLGRLCKRWTTPKREETILIRTNQGNELVKIRGVIGLYLDCRPTDGRFARFMVDETQAMDRKFYWRQWRAWGGGPLYLDDGRRYKPWK